MNRQSFLLRSVPLAGCAAFAAAGMGAVDKPATSIAKLVNVRDLGAKGDSVADDTAAVQQALDRVGPDGMVHFPPGVYRITKTLSLAGCPGVRIHGEGRASRLVAGAEMKDLLRVNDFSGGMIDHLDFDGAALAGVCVRVLKGTYFRLDNLDVSNSRDIAIHCADLEGGGKAGVEGMVTNCRLTGLAQNTAKDPGSRMGLVMGKGLTDNHYVNLIIRGFVDTGMEINSASNLLHLVHIYRAPCFQYRTALRIRSSSAYLTQCYFDNFTHTGVEVLARCVSLQNCFFLRSLKAFGEGELHPGDGVRVGSESVAAQQVSVIGCSFVSNVPDKPEHAEAAVTPVRIINGKGVTSVDHTYWNMPRGETRGGGTAKASAGADSLSVFHGLIAAPACVQLTPAGPVGANIWWTEKIGDHSFTIRFSRPLEREVDFHWQASS